jgi:DNA/RNA endonuclease G (NUC1)
MKIFFGKSTRTIADLFDFSSLVRIGLPFLFFLSFLAAYSFACDLEGHFEFNVSNKEEEILYSGCYDAINSGPHIIEYILTKERAEATGIKRPSASFTRVRDGGVLMQLLAEHSYSLPHHNDFTNSGFDRGHMAPNADFNDTYENALMTFFIANIWPQTPNVNRVEWLRTENETRNLASEYLVVKVIIIVDEFKEEKIGNISIPLCFKRRVYDLYSGDLIYEIDIYQ